MILLRTEQPLTKIYCFTRHAEDWKTTCFTPSPGKLSSAIGVHFERSQAEVDRLNSVDRSCDGH